MAEKIDKAFRLLKMHERLSRGESLIKETSVAEFGIPPKTFQRDIDSLRLYYSEKGDGELLYDRKLNCYKLIAEPNNLTKKEIFAICKILIESRAFIKAEFSVIIEKLLRQCDEVERKAVKSIISNEQVNYIPLQHGKPLVDLLWKIAVHVEEQVVIELVYKRSDGMVRRHTLKPVGIMFSEFYFYLIAYIVDESKPFPTVFRADRIVTIMPTDQRFEIPYRDKFDETEFRKRVQFMYGGELRTVRFLFKGVAEAVLDRLPTSQIIKETDEGLLIQAEAYGSGIDMWLNSQGDKVKLV